MMRLTTANVQAVFEACMYSEVEIMDGGYGPDKLPPDCLQAHGIMNNVIFNPVRTFDHRPVIWELLSQLSDDFRKELGGGMSFLQMPFDRDGNQWGEQINAEQLFLVGQAAGLAALCMPREFWSLFPGGMPYIVIDLLESPSIQDTKHGA